MMKWYKNIALFFSVVVFCTAIGCDDFLTVDPEDQNTIQQQFSTRENALEAIAGMYSLISSAFYQQSFVYYGDLQAGNLAYTPDTGSTNLGQISINTIPNIYDFADEALDSEMAAVYGDIYEGINAINIILENINSTPNISDSELAQIRSECLAARGFLHFCLARIYAQSFAFDNSGSQLGIVYNTRTLTVGVDFPSRTSLAETLDLIRQDLNEALEISTGDSIIDIESRYVLTSNVIQAIISDVALWSQDYEQVVTSANELINNSGLQLTTTENYVTEWIQNSDISEAIYILPTSEDELGGISRSMTNFWEFLDEENFSDLSGSGDLINLFDTSNDVRFTQLLNQQNLITLVNGENQLVTYYFTNKYDVDKGMVLYRLSEIYLMRAEAHYRLGNTMQALLDLNLIRNRAGLDDIITTDNLENEILLERRRELAFENKAFYDLSRFGRDVVRNIDCMAATCNLSYPDFRYVLPIPDQSINVNSNLQQNEGY